MRFFTYRGVEHYIRANESYVNTLGFKENIVRKFVIQDDAADRELIIIALKHFIDAVIANMAAGNAEIMSGEKAYCMAVFYRPKEAIDTAIANRYGLEGLMGVHDELDRFKPGTYLSTSTILGTKVVTVNGVQYTEIETNNTIYFLLPLP